VSLDQLTVLRARSGLLAKRLESRNGAWYLHGYSAGRWFAVRSVDVHDLGSLAAALEVLVHDPRCCIVRGQLIPGVDVAKCRRLSDRAEHGDAVTFEACARHWLALDIDEVDEPPGLQFTCEPEAGIEHVLELLGLPFNAASCWWQGTSSAGIKPGIRCRLWFWCSRPVADEEAKGWLAKAPVDRALYSPVQPHYVAAPVLAEGAREPVIRRCGLRLGETAILQLPNPLPRFERVEVKPVQLALHELSASYRRRLAAALARTRVASAIWHGERSYPDRSSRHFAFASALVRAGLNQPADYDLIAAALVALDAKLGVDGRKISRPDYLARTIAAAVARAAA
jgi:hypothetical protein